MMKCNQFTRPKEEPFSIVAPAFMTQINRKTLLAYSSTVFAASCIGVVFESYLVEVFINSFKLDRSYFVIGQILFAVWNAINDPLLGYISDYLVVQRKVKRSHLILYGAPLFSLSFLLPWYPWSASGLYNDSIVNGRLGFMHFLVTLYVWDSALTWVLLAHCSLLPETTVNLQERGRLSSYAQIMSLVGSLSIFPTYDLFERSSMFAFRTYCFLLSVVSFFGFAFTGLTMSQSDTQASNVTRGDRYKDEDTDVEMASTTEADSPISDRSDAAEPESMISYWEFCKQVLRLPNFLIFVAVNFLNIFATALIGAFAVVASEQIVTPYLGQRGASVFFSMSALAPNIFGFALTYWTIQNSSYRLMKNLFLSRFVLCAVTALLILLFGSTPSLIAVVFLFSNRMLVSVGRLLEMSLADIVDEDELQNNRKSSMSSSIFALNALITKGAQSLGPSFGVYFLSQYGYGEDKKTEYDPQFAAGILKLFIVVGLIVYALQYLIWRMFTLHTARLTNVKQLLVAKRTKQ